MFAKDLTDRAAARGFRVEQHEPNHPYRLSVVTAAGRVLGTVFPVADGTWVAVPANVPVEVGSATDTLDYLAVLEHVETHCVQLTHGESVVLSANQSEEVVFTAVKGAFEQMADGRPEVVIVGGSSAEL